MAEFCKKCGRAVSGDEIAICRKLIGSTVRGYLCAGCLAAHFRCSRELIEEKIRYYKDMGCSFFR